MMDLGCGDGRILRSAVHDFGAARAIGYELDQQLATSAREAAAGDSRIVVRCEDFFTSSASALSEADVITLYLSESGNAKLWPLLQRHCKPTVRVVSNVWDSPVRATRTVRQEGSFVPLHLWEHADLFAPARFFAAGLMPLSTPEEREMLLLQAESVY